jgi:UPF0716 protein FxsA
MVFLLLLLWPIAELYVIVVVAEAIGALDTVLLLLAGVPLGTWALRSQGAAVWRRMTAAAAAGTPPARHVIDGALVIVGGTLLIVPGFITDVLGILLLAPPTRALIRRLVVRNFKSRVIVRAARFTQRPGSTYDVDSTAADVDPPHLRP